MNKTEHRYAQRLGIFMASGQIKNWRYEAIKFRLANRTWYTPDFAVTMPDGHVQFHEVKGPYVREKGRIKWKVCADLYPEFVWIWAQESKRGVWKVSAYDGRSK